MTARALSREMRWSRVQPILKSGLSLGVELAVLLLFVLGRDAAVTNPTRNDSNSAELIIRSRATALLGIPSLRSTSKTLAKIWGVSRRMLSFSSRLYPLIIKLRGRMQGSSPVSLTAVSINPSHRSKSRTDLEIHNQVRQVVQIGGFAIQNHQP